MRLTFLGICMASTSLILFSCGKPQIVEPVGSGSTGVTIVNTGSTVTYTSEKVDLVKDDLKNISAHMFSAEGMKNIQSYVDALTGTSTDTVLKRSYIESLKGDYTSALADRDNLCRSDSTQCPGENITLTIEGAKDQSGNTIEQPNIYLNGKKINATTGKSKPLVYKNFVHRVRAEKEGYLDAYDKLNGIEGGFNDLSIAPRMARADKSISLDASVGATENAGNVSYMIAPNTFKKESGEPVSGKVDLYLFSLDRNDNDLSVFRLDAFGPDGSRRADSFVTYGMPYVTAYQNGEPLTIGKPIEGTGTILYTEGMDLKGVPKNEWLSGDQLGKYNIPPFWHLDREAGVWNEAKMMILDEKGTYKFSYEF